MSILKETDLGYFISHEKYIKNVFEGISGGFHEDLFKIETPYKKTKERSKRHQKSVDSEFEKEINFVEKTFNTFINQCNPFSIFTGTSNGSKTNEDALKFAEKLYQNSPVLTDIQGSNYGPALIKEINSHNYLFPSNCEFFCKDISCIANLSRVYDLIVLDPPWWNKYIRRKRKHSANSSYLMMFNDDLKELPLDLLLHKTDGLIAVWCTNSKQHLQAIKEEFFPSWGVEYLCKWYWIKMTRNGEAICAFSTPPRKQPFEQIIFGRRKERKLPNPAENKLVISVPSAIHSHKPPLDELLRPFLDENTTPNCLELFARYLVPNWTSVGNETLKLQHYSLYS